MPSPLSLLLDAIQRSSTLWYRLGAASRQADVYAAAVADELAQAPEERRAALLEARMVPPVGPWERLLTYGQWARERAREVEDEGVTGGGKGEGWWPDVAGREEREDDDESANGGREEPFEAANGGDDGQSNRADGGVAGEPVCGAGRSGEATGSAPDREKARPRTREQLIAGPEAEARIAALKAQHGKAKVRVRWGRRHTDAYGKGVVSYPAEEE